MLINTDSSLILDVLELHNQTKADRTIEISLTVREKSQRVTRDGGHGLESEYQRSIIL
jgi:hypothetical protein